MRCAPRESNGPTHLGLCAPPAEKISFNAMPAAWASPRGGDMWAHPYLQAVNEVNAIKADPHAWQVMEDPQ